MQQTLGKRIWFVFLSLLREYPSLVALLGLMLLFGAVNPRFFTLSNLFNILDLVSLLMITGSAMSFVLMMGSIDLSVEGVVGLSGVVASFLVKNFSNSNDFGYLALPLCLGVGLGFGLLNGVIFSRFRIPSFMTTLGVGFVTNGIGVLLTKGNPVVISDWNFRQIGMGRLGPIPIAFIVATALLVVMWLISERTFFGRHILAIGGDEVIAKDLGVRVERVKIGVFGIAGALYGIVGALLTAKLGSGDITAPRGFTFDSISASVLGGVAITGGVGSISRGLIGAFILTVLRNGMILMGVSPYIQQGVVGAILIVTVALTLDRTKIQVLK
ncbi:MAG: ABC transporter permease [Candidatus Methanomethylicaceae archaeon]